MDLDSAFKFSCKVVFGRELGEASEFEEYLREPVVGTRVKSSFSGKELFVTSEHYPKNAKFFDYEHERKEGERISSVPLSINDIKDIDSLVDAVRERWLYSGNKVLGNSQFVERSDNVFDSQYVKDSSFVMRSKYVLHSYIIRETDYSFGSTSTSEATVIIRCLYNNSLRRCFECSYSVNSSDLVFCFNVVGGQECLFSYNLRNPKHCIGNIPLEKGKYAELRKKLVGELADELEKKKRLDFSIVNLA